MAKRSAEDETTAEGAVEELQVAHPYAFHVSGPRNVSSPNWRDLINSSWFVPLSFPSGITTIYRLLSIFLNPGFSGLKWNGDCVWVWRFLDFLIFGFFGFLGFC